MPKSSYENVFARVPHEMHILLSNAKSNKCKTEMNFAKVGCILPALKLYMFQFWLPPLDVTLGVGVG